MIQRARPNVVSQILQRFVPQEHSCLPCYRSGCGGAWRVETCGFPGDLVGSETRNHRCGGPPDRFAVEVAAGSHGRIHIVETSVRPWLNPRSNVADPSASLPTWCLGSTRLCSASCSSVVSDFPFSPRPWPPPDVSSRQDLPEARNGGHPFCGPRHGLAAFGPMGGVSNRWRNVCRCSTGHGWRLTPRWCPLGVVLGASERMQQLWKPREEGKDPLRAHWAVRQSWTRSARMVLW